MAPLTNRLRTDLTIIGRIAVNIPLVGASTMEFFGDRTGKRRRTGKDRRSGIDTRTEKEKKLIGERRSGVDRRSGLDRRVMAREVEKQNQSD
jgi:hypothetical protein